MEEEIELENDCPTHGDSVSAKDKFWKNPLTSHWQCRCKGVGRSEAVNPLSE